MWKNPWQPMCAKISVRTAKPPQALAQLNREWPPPLPPAHISNASSVRTSTPGVYPRPTARLQKLRTIGVCPDTPAMSPTMCLAMSLAHIHPPGVSDTPVSAACVTAPRATGACLQRAPPHSCEGPSVGHPCGCTGGADTSTKASPQGTPSQHRRHALGAAGTASAGRSISILSPQPSYTSSAPNTSVRDLAKSRLPRKVPRPLPAH